MHTLWPAAGHALLDSDDRGHLTPTPAYIALHLSRPELAPVETSCRAERALHRSLSSHPMRPVTAADLHRLRDADARENIAHFIAWRDALRAAGTLQAWYLTRFRATAGDSRALVRVPPVLIDTVAQAIVQQVMVGDGSGSDDSDGDALAWRAAELWFRPQRVTVEQGRVLAADRDTLAQQQATGGLGDIGRLLVQSGAPVQRADLRVLGAAEAPRYFADAALPDFTSRLLLDLTHETTIDIGHGLHFTVQARSGLQPLAAVLGRWVRHLLGIDVRVTPLQRIDDPHWRWHVGLDAEASSLLNDLYEDREVDTARLQRIVSLFKLEFANPAEMRRDVAGKPVYLGLMADGGQVLRMKPQNLLVNLPLASPAA